MDGQSCHGTQCVDTGIPSRGRCGAVETALHRNGVLDARRFAVRTEARAIVVTDSGVRRRLRRRGSGVLGPCRAGVGRCVGRCGRDRGRGVHHPRRRIGQLSARRSRSAAGVAEGHHSLTASVDDLGTGRLARRGVRNGPVDAVPRGVADLARSCRRHSDSDDDRRSRRGRLGLHGVPARRTCHRYPAGAAAVHRRRHRVHGECCDDARRRLVSASTSASSVVGAALPRRSSTPRSSWRVG